MHLSFTLLEGTQPGGCIHPYLAFFHVIYEIYSRLVTRLHISNYDDITRNATQFYSVYTEYLVILLFTRDTPPTRMAYISIRANYRHLV